MTIKDLQRIVLTSEHSKAEDSPAMKELLKRTRDKRFWWIGNENEHSRRFKQTNGNCCFSHILQLPRAKPGLPQGFWEYQHAIYKALFIPSYVNARAPTPEEEEKYRKLLIGAEIKSQSKEGNIKQTHQDVLAERSKELIHNHKVKHLWIKKATGLGITELLIRIMVWLAVRNDDYKNSQMVVVTGPNQDLAIKIIKRMKALFEPHGITFDSKKPSYICNICSQTLVRLTDSGGNNQTYWCRHCSVEWDPTAENIRRESKLSVPDRNAEPAVASIQFDYNKSVEVRHEPEIKGGLKELQKKGLKITNYKEDIPK